MTIPAKSTSAECVCGLFGSPICGKAFVQDETTTFDGFCGNPVEDADPRCGHDRACHAAESVSGIHSCSYYCNLPECLKRQRDELRDRFVVGAEPDGDAERAKFEAAVRSTWEHEDFDALLAKDALGDYITEYAGDAFDGWMLCVASTQPQDESEGE